MLVAGGVELQHQFVEFQSAAGGQVDHGVACFQQNAVHHKTPHTLVNVPEELVACHAQENVNGAVVDVVDLLHLGHHVGKFAWQLTGLRRGVVGSGNQHSAASELSPFQCFFMSCDGVQFKCRVCINLEEIVFDHGKEFLPGLTLIGGDVLIRQLAPANGNTVQNGLDFGQGEVDVFELNGVVNQR